MRRTHIYIFIALFAVGGLLELLQSAGNAARKNNKLTVQEIADEDVKPFVRTERTDGKILSKAKKFAQSDRISKWKQRQKKFKQPKSQKTTIVPEAHDFEHKGKTAKKGKDAKKKKKKKKNAKKNKDKKDKDKDEQTDVPEDTEVAESNEEEETKEENTENEEPEPTELMAAPTAIVDNQQTNNELPIGYEEWARLVLVSPDYAATNKMIQYYHNSLVSPEVYFQIIREMVQDSREELVVYGVMAAGASPHPESYDILYSVTRNQRQGNKPHKQAKAYLSTTYVQFTHLRHLRTVINTNETVDVVIHAVQTLSDSALKNLTATATKVTVDTEPATETDQGEDTKKEEAQIDNPQLQKKGRAYLSATNDLKALISSSSNASATAAAQKALETINALLIDIGFDINSNSLAQISVNR